MRLSQRGTWNAYQRRCNGPSAAVHGYAVIRRAILREDAGHERRQTAAAQSQRPRVPAHWRERQRRRPRLSLRNAQRRGICRNRIARHDRRAHIDCRRERSTVSV